MNKRIQEFALQSDLLFHLAKGAPYPSAMTAEESLAAYQKFAELIVRECASVVSSVPPCHGDYRDQIEVGMRDYCARKVLEHFGVRE